MSKTISTALCSFAGTIQAWITRSSANCCFQMCLLVAPFPHLSSLAPLKQSSWRHDHTQAAVTKGAQPGTRSWLPALMFTSVSSKPQVFLFRELPLKHKQPPDYTREDRNHKPWGPKINCSVFHTVPRPGGSPNTQTRLATIGECTHAPSLKSSVDWSPPGWNGNCTSDTMGPLWLNFYKHELRHYEDMKSDLFQ